MKNLSLSNQKGFKLLVLLVVFVLFSQTIQVVFSQGSFLSSNSGDKNVVWDKWFRAYEIVVELSKAGMNISSYLPSLQEAYDYLEKGEYGSAENILDKILPGLTKLYEEKDSFVFWKNFKKVTLAVLIGSFPVLFYFFFPRIYLRIWYKVREKWVVGK